MMLLDAAQRWWDAKAAEGHSRKTQIQYRLVVKRFTDFLHADLPRLEQLNAQSAREFAMWLRHQGVAQNSTYHYLTVLKAFCSWLEQEGVVERDPLAKVKRGRRDQVQIECVEHEEFMELLYEARRGKNKLRDEALLLAMVDTGVRVSELCAMQLGHLHLSRRGGSVLIPSGKGAKHRTVYMSEPTADAIERYTEGRRGRPQAETPYLWLASDGAQMRPVTIRHWLQRLTERVTARTGLRKRIHPHMFRHTFATNYLRYNRGDLEGLRIQLGHSDYTTTRIYLELVSADIEQGHRIGSPVLNWGIRPRGRKAHRL